MAKSPAQEAMDRIVEMESQRDPIYILGRLLAVTESIVWMTRGENAASDLVVDAFERLPLMPARYYVRLSRTAVPSLSKIKTDWRRDVYDRLLTQAGAEVGAGLPLPERLNDEQFGVFQLGYHHQRAALIAMNIKRSREEYDEAMELAKDAVARLVAAGMSESEAAYRVGLNRMTVRKALGK